LYTGPRDQASGAPRQEGSTLIADRQEQKLKTILDKSLSASKSGECPVNVLGILVFTGRA